MAVKPLPAAHRAPTQAPPAAARPPTRNVRHSHLAERRHRARPAFIARPLLCCLNLIYQEPKWIFFTLRYVHKISFPPLFGCQSFARGRHSCQLFTNMSLSEKTVWSPSLHLIFLLSITFISKNAKFIKQFNNFLFTQIFFFNFYSFKYQFNFNILKYKIFKKNYYFKAKKI